MSTPIEEPKSAPVSIPNSPATATAHHPLSPTHPASAPVSIANSPSNRSPAAAAATTPSGSPAVTVPLQEQVYVVPKRKDFEKFKSAFSDVDGWEERLREGKLTVHTKEIPPSDFLAIRATVVWEDVNADVVYDALHDHDYRRTWDESMIEGYTIVTLTKNCDIGYYSLKFPLTLSNRDFVNLRTWRFFQETAEYFIISSSVPHKDAPPKKSFVRASTVQTGFYIRSLGDNKTELNWYTHTDPKGLIPAFIANTMLTKLGPGVLEKFHKLATKYPLWKTKQPHKDSKPWLEEENQD